MQFLRYVYIFFVLSFSSKCAYGDRRRKTKFPTKFPTRYPSKFPTRFPTRYPSNFPTRKRRTRFPTKRPTNFPTAPTQSPSLSPTGWYDFCLTKLNGRCQNNITDGDETSIDCGGLLCSRCRGSSNCLVDNDCESMLCIGGYCKTDSPSASPTVVPTDAPTAPTDAPTAPTDAPTSAPTCEDRVGITSVGGEGDATCADYSIPALYCDNMLSDYGASAPPGADYDDTATLPELCPVSLKDICSTCASPPPSVFDDFCQGDCDCRATGAVACCCYGDAYRAGDPFSEGDRCRAQALKFGDSAALLACASTPSPIPSPPPPSPPAPPP